jgi:hypothetical protein
MKQRYNTNQKHNTMTSTPTSIDNAWRYLQARGALDKLGTPVPVIGRNVVFYIPAPTAALDGVRVCKPNRYRSVWRRVRSVIESL